MLSFINGSNRIPASLRVINEEIQKEGFDKPNINNWEQQGIFLLNTALTVETGNAGSHLKYWKDFTKRIVQFIAKENPCLWFLWGKKAQDYGSIINDKFNTFKYDRETINEIPINPTWNYIIPTPHPAAEVYAGGKAGFYGSDVFYKTNVLLKKLYKKEIIW